jgi:hypothetical protein
MEHEHEHVAGRGTMGYMHSERRSGHIKQVVLPREVIPGPSIGTRGLISSYTYVCMVSGITNADPLAGVLS